MELADFPYLPMRGRHDCGPTALLQILRFAGHHLDRQTLETLWGFSDRDNRSDTPGDHLRVLARLGIPAAMRAPLATEEIEAALSRGFPVLLLLSLGPLHWHWVAATGFDDESLRLSDGSGAPQEMPRERFERLFSGGPAGRFLRVRRLGCVVGERSPWPADRELAGWLLRLARAAKLVVPPTQLFFRAGPAGPADRQRRARSATIFA